MLKRYFTLFILSISSVILFGQTAKISGAIKLFSGEAMPNTTVVLLDENDNRIAQMVTGSDGTYEFANLATNNTYKIQPERAGSLLQAVSVIDLLVLIKHILLIQPYTSPYQYLAGDVNMNNGNTTFDIVLIQKAILDVGDPLSWRFIRSVETFTDPSNPFLDISETDNEVELTADITDFNFTGIPLGDINLSFDPSNL